jgi:hypothetical protein
MTDDAALQACLRGIEVAPDPRDQVHTPTVAAPSVQHPVCTLAEEVPVAHR